MAVSLGYNGYLCSCLAIRMDDGASTIYGGGSVAGDESVRNPRPSPEVRKLTDSMDHT